MVEQIRFQEALAIGDRNDVGRNVGRNVIGLGLDDRQTRHRTGAKFIGELRAALEQTRMQVEHIAGVSLATWWAAQQQRDGAVSLGVLG